LGELPHLSARYIPTIIPLWLVNGGYIYIIRPMGKVHPKCHPIASHQNIIYSPEIINMSQSLYIYNL
jgi:hypothetical protein